MLTLVFLHNREEWMEAHTFPPPAPEPPCLRAFGCCSVRGSRGGAAALHSPPNTRVCVCLHMQIRTPSLENYFWRPLSHRYHEFIPSVCFKRLPEVRIWSWHMKFSYVITENYISLLDRFSDVQLCFLYPKVPKIKYFLYMLCKKTHRHDFESNKKIQSIMETLNESNITTHFLLPAFVLLRTPLLRSS